MGDLQSDLDDFSDNLANENSALLDQMSNVAPLVGGVFDIIPAPVAVSISGVVVFIVIRKVVGR